MTKKKTKPKRTPPNERQKAAQRNLEAIWKAKSKELELTQLKVGTDWGITQAAVGKFISGETVLNVENVLKFAKALKVHPTMIDPEIADLLQDWKPEQPRKEGIHEEIEKLSPWGKGLVRVAIKLAQGGEAEGILRPGDQK